jgi:hypothetical protein
MAEECLMCAIKHIAKADAKIDEARLSPEQYGWTVWKAVGHMSEAEDHLREKFPKLAITIREERLAFMDFPLSYDPRLNTILRLLNRQWRRSLEEDDERNQSDV